MNDLVSASQGTSGVLGPVPCWFRNSCPTCSGVTVSFTHRVTLFTDLRARCGVSAPSTGSNSTRDGDFILTVTLLTWAQAIDPPDTSYAPSGIDYQHY